MELLRQILQALGAYAGGQFRISLILTVLYAIGFAILRVPGWPFLAVVSGFLNLIPILGGVVAMLLAAGSVWMGGGTLYRVLAVLGVCVAVQAVEGFYVTPKILGRKLALSPLLVFGGLMVGGALFGFLGILLAVPALAVGLVIWKFLQSTR
jgi:predicted PurR-regulated permease PerM